MGIGFGARVERWLEHPRATLWIVLLTCVVTLPTLGVGFFADDYILRDALRGIMPFHGPWYDLYLFAPGTLETNRAAMAVGQLPWWTALDIKVHLFRPLASVLLALDERLFGDAAAFWHVHSILWYVALVAVMGVFYRRVLPRATATLALLLFAIDECHVHPFGWVSARHGTIATVFTVLAIVAYMRDCEEGWKWGRWLAALGLVAGLAAGETAIGVAAYGFTYALLAPAKGGARRARAVAAIPVVVVLAVYLVVYHFNRCGVAHSGEYFDPLGEPGAFGAAALTRVPALIADGVFAVPADLLAVLPKAPFVALGLFGVALVAWLYRACRASMSEAERAALGWLVPGAGIALVVTIGAFPGARLLLGADVGFAAIFAMLIRRALPAGVDGGGWQRVARRGVAGYFAFVHVGLAPVLAVITALSAGVLARTTQAIGTGADLEGAVRPRVFVLAASDPSLYYVAPTLALEEPGRVACWTILSGAKADHVVTRTTATSVSIEPVETTFLHAPFEELFRSPKEALELGDERRVCGASVRVAAMRGGRPSRIDVDFGTPLEDASLRLLAWRDGKLQRVNAGVGERVELAWSVGPMLLF